MPAAKKTSRKRSRKTTTKGKPNPTTDPIQLIPHSSLHPSSLNPRRHAEEQALTDLAESIHAQGILHNLIARPCKEGYEIAAGERRYRAVGMLIEQGRLPEDTTLPVHIRALSDLELIELATSENSERADMHPLDEAHAYHQMLHLGSDIPSIALRMGKSEQTVNQRLALHNRLCDEAKEALYDGTITLAQAQQLTAASPDLQHHLLERIQADQSYGRTWNANDLKDFLTNRLLKVKDAIFPLEDYQGEITNNLFDPEAEAAFCDTDQALALQSKAVEELKANYLETWAWVDVIEPWQYTDWRYTQPEDDITDPKTQGVVITVDRHSWQVNIHEGVLSTDNATSQRSNNAGPSRGEANTSRRENEPRAKTPKDGYTRKHLTLARQIKSRALQTELAKNHRICLILTIMGLMGSSEVTLKTEQTQSHHGLGEETQALKRIYDQHLPFLKKTFDLWEVETYPLSVSSHDPEKQLALYRYLRELADVHLHELYNALIAWSFGSWPTEQPNTGDSPLAREIADDLGLDMSEHFTLNEAFLSLYRKAKLSDLARDLGIPFDMSGMKVKGIVAYLQMKLTGKQYLPGLIQFLEKGAEPPTGIVSGVELEQVA